MPLFPIQPGDGICSSDKPGNRSGCGVAICIKDFLILSTISLPFIPNIDLCWIVDGQTTWTMHGKNRSWSWSKYIDCSSLSYYDEFIRAKAFSDHINRDSRANFEAALVNDLKQVNKKYFEHSRNQIALRPEFTTKMRTNGTLARKIRESSEFVTIYVYLLSFLHTCLI